MSKSIDFSKPGGYPFTQEDLAYLQAAWTEMVAALAQSGNLAGPYILYGCVVTKTAVGGSIYDYAITAGWIMYEGNLVRVEAGGYGGLDVSVDEPYMVLTATSVPNALPFDDASTPNVINDVTGAIGAEAIGAADTDSYFALSELRPYGVALGQANRPGFTAVAVATASGLGGVSGNMYWKVDSISNVLWLKGTLSAADPYNLDAYPTPSAYVMMTLPAVARPAVNSVFRATLNVLDVSNNILTDSTGVQYLVECEGRVLTNGVVEFVLPEPVAGCVMYQVVFTTGISLD